MGTQTERGGKGKGEPYMCPKEKKNCKVSGRRQEPFPFPTSCPIQASSGQRPYRGGKGYSRIQGNSMESAPQTQSLIPYSNAGVFIHVRKNRQCTAKGCPPHELLPCQKRWKRVRKGRNVHNSLVKPRCESHIQRTFSVRPTEI